MKAIMVMYDSLNRHMLQCYGGSVNTPNFERLAQHSVTFDNCWVGSMPCMPARRELHTGRYNFLHRSWGPLEPFDDSMPETLRTHGIHTHLVTDHYHYFEDGGATYHTRYTTYESVRGQEGDAWKGVVGYGKMPQKHLNKCGNPGDKWVEQDFTNRSFMQDEDCQPQSKTFANGLEFIKCNHNADNWFLQLETFDPHEPFFTQEQYKQLYKDKYDGDFCDWPDYRAVNDSDSEELIEHLRSEYAALLTMCDENLGKVLDMMDKYNMWQDTMLIVNTDHGFLLSEHGQWAKCHCPFYAEVAHTPLFVWDPRLALQGVRRNALVQTIDLPATLLEFFGLRLFHDMQGKPLKDVMVNDSAIHDGALFGIFGGQICCTDGHYVYMRSPKPCNAPLYEYTLMPMRHGGRRAFIGNEILENASLEKPFAFTKGMPVMKLKGNSEVSQAKYPDMLFCMDSDPKQLKACQDEPQKTKMINLMQKLMRETNSPIEQYERMGF